MRKEGFTLVEIMIVVAIIATLASIAIPNLLRARMTANDAAARRTAKSIVDALEVYAGANGEYPDSIYNLTNITPPYLPSYIDQDMTTAITPRHGYLYTFAGGTPMPNGYMLTVFPQTCNRTGSKTYIFTTGGAVAVSDCP